MKARHCSTLVLRDLADDPELVRVLTGQGFVPVPLLERYLVPLAWRGEAAFIAALPSHRQRRHVRAIHEHSPLFEVEVWDSRSAASDDELGRMYALYRRMAAKNLRINIFPLPPKLLRAQLESGSWEFVLLRPGAAVRRSRGPPRPAGREYRALYCGVDYDDFRAAKINPYRQLLWQLVRRAGRLGCERLHLGMGAGLEKTRFGATASPALALVRADDAFAATRLQEFVTRTALRSAGRS
nr:hypothetical protein [Nannocystis pusilla]